MRVVLLHGYKSSPDQNFFPWLKDELRKLDVEVVVPSLPNPEEPNLDEWLEATKKEVGRLDNETMVLGHSLGGVLALKMLERFEMHGTPKASIFVATPWKLGAEKFETFFSDFIEWDELMWKSQEWLFVHSKDDPVVPVDHSEAYAKVLDGEVLLRDEEGHYQGEKYPVLLDLIKERIQTPGGMIEDQFADLRPRN